MGCKRALGAIIAQRGLDVGVATVKGGADVMPLIENNSHTS